MSKCWSRLLLASSWMCLQTATLSDGIKPRIECPSPQVKYITMNTDTIVEIFDKSNVNVSDNSGPGPSVMFDPPSIVLDRTSINHVQQIEATATYDSGNNNTCRFEYLIKAAPCSPLSLETPLHGSKSCAAKFGGSGFTCSISCDTGYVFYDLSTSKTSISTLHLQCDTGVPWSVNIPACADAKKLAAIFQQKFQVHYNYTGTANQAICKTVYADLIKNKFAVKTLFDQFGSICDLIASASISEVSVTNPATDVVIDDTSKQVFIDYTILYIWTSKSALSTCSLLLKTILETTGTGQSNVMDGDLSPISCPVLRVVYQTKPDGSSAVALAFSKNYACPSDKKHILFKGSEMCLECPEGTYNSGVSTCQLCPIGTYNNRSGQTACLNCDPGTSTYREGSTNSSHCFPTCQLGSYSDNQLQPCASCPLNTYGVNTTYCQPCPATSTTHEIGATSISMCRVCDYNHYGEECSNLCSSRHCDDRTGISSCDVNGSCEWGCKPGWMGVDCIEKCPKRQYGQDCGKLCANRKCQDSFGSSCDHVTGKCVGGCSPGYLSIDCTKHCDYVHYGVNCKSICAQRHCKGDQFCDFKFGNCKDGCLLGWKGRNCNESCDPDHYGYGCSKQCSIRHCDETVGISSCDATGSCDRGCIPGWTGTDCLERCDGKYGSGCSSLCSARHCRADDARCDHVTGSCDGPCDAGWQGETCTDSCNVGLYGTDCALDCNKRQCKNKAASCNHVDGSCGGECQGDYTGIDCTGCDGKYGPGCSSSCSARHCRSDDAPCDHVTGSCDGPCDAGWKGETCTDKCDTGTYGDNCVMACAARHCIDINVCPHQDGECVGGCNSGFQGLDCLKDISSKGDSTKDTDNIIIALAVAAGVFCILFITVTCIHLWYVRRHRTKSASCKQEMTSTNNGLSNQVIDTTDVEYAVVDGQDVDRSGPRSQHVNTTHPAIHVNSVTSPDGMEGHPGGYDSESGYVNADQTNEYEHLDAFDLPQNQYEKITGV